MYKVLVSGDRLWQNPLVIEREILALISEHGTRDLMLIGGGAPGADTIAKALCTTHNVHFAEVKALWGTRYRSAGPQRNRAMLGLNPDELIAFHHNISESRGTKDMVTAAKKVGVPCRIVRK